MKTGAILNPIDNRDIQIAQVQSPVAIPNSFTTDISMLPIENQGMHGACVGFAIGKLKQYFDYLETKKVTPLSPRYMYGLAKETDGIPHIDGTYPRHVAGISNKNGCATVKTVPNNVSLGRNEYISIPNRKEADKEALPFRTKGYATIANSTEALRQALFQNKLITVSLPVGNWSRAFVKPPRDNSNLHYILVYGYATVRNETMFYFRNSWGSSWGNNGDGFFSSKDYEGRYFDALAFTDLPNEIIEEARSKWRYFKDSEVVGLHWKLVDMLDEARHNSGTPFRITSGLRTVEQNRRVGGVSNSPHLRGLAVDIACTTSENRMKIIQGAIKAGFNRIGIGNTFVHLDCDTSLPQNVVWHYYQNNVAQSTVNKTSLFLEGKKTYLGIIMLALGAFGFSDLIVEAEVSSFIDAILSVVGTLVAVYGRYQSNKLSPTVSSKKVASKKKK